MTPLPATLQTAFSRHISTIRRGVACVFALGAACAVEGCSKTEESAPEWLKDQWESAVKVADAAVGSLKSIDARDLKAKLASLTTAMEEQDFGEAEKIGSQIEALLSTHNLEDGLKFVMIQRQKGGDAAVNAVQEFADRDDLTEFERAAAEKLKTSMAFIQRNDVREGLSAALIFACESKLGAHRGVLVAVPIISILFPDLDPTIESNGTSP